MGAEAICVAEFGGARGEGRAYLESDHLAFRGPFRLRIPFGDIRNIEAQDGRLVVATPEGTAVFELGGRAGKWLDRIRNPKGRLDKLGITPGRAVALVDVADPDLGGELAARGIVPAADGPVDVLLLGVESRAALDAVPGLRGRIAPAGGLWIVYPKGRRDVTEGDVLAAGRTAGLKDNKVIAFSATHTALRFVVPRAERG